MITSLEIQSAQGNVLNLPLTDDENGIVVAEIEGLDPVKAVLVSSSFAKRDGEQYQSARRETRIIKLTLDLEPDYITTTVKNLRTRLYAYLMPKSSVKLRFVDDGGLTVDISGVVETFESPLFTAEPQAIISITCFDPDFLSILNTITSGASTSTLDEEVINYTGSVDSGIKFTLEVNRNLNAFTIYHRPSDGSLRTLDFAAPLTAGDVLTINTVPGSKSAIVKNGTTERSVLYGVSPQSSWITLTPGENHLTVYAEGAPVPFWIEYVNRHGAI